MPGIQRTMWCKFVLVGLVALVAHGVSALKLTQEDRPVDLATDRKLELRNKDMGVVLERPKAFNIFLGSQWTPYQRRVMDNLAANIGASDYMNVRLSTPSLNGVAPAPIEFLGSKWDSVTKSVAAFDTANSDADNGFNTFMKKTIQKYIDTKTIQSPGDFDINSFDLGATRRIFLIASPSYFCTHVLSSGFDVASFYRKHSVPLQHTQGLLIQSVSPLYWLP